MVFGLLVAVQPMPTVAIQSNPSNYGLLYQSEGSWYVLSHFDASPILIPQLDNHLYLVEWSASARRLAFTSYGLQSLYIVDLESDTTEQAVNLEGDDRIIGVSFSPDGNSLLYRHSTAGLKGYSGPSLILYNITTKQERLVAYTWRRENRESFRSNLPLDSNSHYFCYDLDWSPDGELIAFIACEPYVSRVGIYVMNRECIEHSADCVLHFYDDSPTEQTLGDWTSLDWSPDGQTLVFECDGEICTMDQDGSNLRQLPYNKPPSMGNYFVDRSDSQIEWSPDGRYLAYRSDSDRLHLIDLTTEAETYVVPRTLAENVDSFTWVTFPEANALLEN